MLIFTKIDFIIKNQNYEDIDCILSKKINKIVNKYIRLRSEDI